MADFCLDTFSSDPIVVVVQTLLEKSSSCSNTADINLRYWDKGVETSLDDLVHNIKLVNSFKGNLPPKVLESIRSGLPIHFESFRMFFVEVVYKRIVLNADKRYAHHTILHPFVIYCHFRFYLYVMNCPGKIQMTKHSCSCISPPFTSELSFNSNNLYFHHPK